MNKIYDCLIIGCGPAGIGAAIALKKANIDVAIIDRTAPGGKVNIAPRVDNYPGFTKIPGPDLAYELYKRLKASNTLLIKDMVNSLIKNDNFILKCENDTYFSKTVILASGTKERKLGLEKEDELLGHGVSYCAICDGHFFKQKDILVVGGGNSALKEAIYLSNLVNHLILIHRRNEFRGNEKLVEELRNKSNVSILTPYIPMQILGNETVTGVIIQNVETKENMEIKVDGLFPLVGQIPNTNYIDIPNVKDEWNTVPVDKSMMTSCSGLFAAGDILPRNIRQIYLAEHDGMVAAKSVVEFLNK